MLEIDKQVTTPHISSKDELKPQTGYSLITGYLGLVILSLGVGGLKKKKKM